MMGKKFKRKFDDITTKKFDFFLFQKSLIRILIGFSFFLITFIVIFIATMNELNWATITTFIFILISVIFIPLKKESLAIYISLIGLTINVFFSTVSYFPDLTLAIQSQMSTGFLILLIIVAAITTNLKFTVFLFLIDSLFLIITTIVYLQNPEIHFVFKNSLYVILSFVFVALLISFIISKILFGTMNKQNDQYIQDLEKSERDLSISNEELEKYVYQISHELKTPLVSIANFISLFQRKNSDLDEKSKHYFNRIEKNIEEMELLILDVLENYRYDHDDGKKKILQIISGF